VFGFGNKTPNLKLWEKVSNKVSVCIIPILNEKLSTLFPVEVIPLIENNYVFIIRTSFD